MNSRRQFIQKMIQAFASLGIVLNPFFIYIRSVYAKVKKVIVPRGTTMESLIGADPAGLDTRNLEIIPLEDFETMGETDHTVDLQQWRLEVAGKVKKTLKLTYTQLLELPGMDRKVLLICPGFFANHGQWKGVSIMELLKLCEAEAGITHITLRGSQGRQEKVDRFPIEDVRSNSVFLAYQVNGQTLPQKHGFPLRAVAEDYHGSSWTKYVYRVEAE